MLTIVARQGGPPSPGAGAGTTINAVIGTFNTTGTGTVSTGFPLKQGQLTDQHIADRKVVVSVGGVEQAVYVEALRGRFPDGSVRSVLIQFSYNTSTTFADGTVEVGGAGRSTSDITKTTIGTTVLEAGRHILPKDVSHTKDCWVTFQPILDAASETSTHTGLLVDQFANRFSAGSAGGLTNGTYQSTYDICVPLFARWQALGSTAAGLSYWWNGFQRAYYFLKVYGLQTQGAGSFVPELNTNGLTASGGSGGVTPPEQHSQSQLSVASFYLLSGAIEANHYLEARASWVTNAVDNQTLANTLDYVISAGYLPRFNLKGFWSVMLSAVIDNTNGIQSIPGGWTGNDLGGASGAPTQLPWYINAWITHAYNLGDYRDGIVGVYDGCTDGVANGAPANGDFPNFQLALSARALLFYYLNVKADDAIATMIQANVDCFIDNNLVAISPPASGTLLGTHTATTADLGTNAPATDITGRYIYFKSSIQRLVTAYNTGTGVATFATVSPQLVDGDSWSVRGWNYNAGARWGNDYWMGATGGLFREPDPWTLPMWADVIAFCKAKYGDAKYGTALTKVMAEANVEGDGTSGGSLGGTGDLTWGNASSNWGNFWKLWGEAFAYACSAPYFDVTGLPTGLPSSIRTPTQY